ncbi:hypothetical protein UY3_02811 [Chelonia mydas]|uniref:Uncharacterized protein n=1 Tax=Chelonia mydas TaxID=8469 RepID=M7BPV1_CHEMY|nr:hypothetical protein UY3_02811 [Chelonia mydas]
MELKMVLEEHHGNGIRGKAPGGPGRFVYLPRPQVNRGHGEPRSAEPAYTAGILLNSTTLIGPSSLHRRRNALGCGAASSFRAAQLQSRGLTRCSVLRHGVAGSSRAAQLPILVL